jgi:hypothetical protein
MDFLTFCLTPFLQAAAHSSIVFLLPCGKNESEIIKTQFHSNSLPFRNFSGGALELLTVKLECNVSIKDGCNN